MIQILNQKITFRTTDKQKKKLMELSCKYHLTLSQVIKDLLNTGNIRKIHLDNLTHLANYYRNQFLFSNHKSIANQLNKIRFNLTQSGNNLNQITHLANCGISVNKDALNNVKTQLEITNRIFNIFLERL